MADCKVSLILPSLNVSEYIRETIMSAVRQTERDIEILCIDAGSTDGTIDIINSIASEDSRIKLIMSDKRSYGYQVNLGIDAAKGKYIAILETDDFVDREMYEKLYEVAEKNSADYAKADYDAFFTQEDGSYWYFPRKTFSDSFMYERVITPSDHSVVGRDDWYLWQGIYSLDFLRNNNIRFSETPGAAFQDIGFLFWTSAFAKRAIYLKNRFYHYRIDREGASSNLGKNLYYSYAEYLRIKDSLNNFHTFDDDVLKLLYSRMIKSFISSYSRIDESPSMVDERKPVYEWFKREICYAIESGIVNYEDVLPGHRSKLKLLLQSEEMYFEHYSVKTFEGFINDESLFAIFGCGDFGFKAYKYLIGQGKKVGYFFDNNISLWGKMMNGISIRNPKEIVDVPGDTCYVVANEAYYNEIVDQLLLMGVESNKIGVFR